jgi:flagellar biosynthesis anti-sigma factor FlgM
MRIGLNSNDLQGISGKSDAVTSSAVPVRSAHVEAGDGFPEDTVSISSLATRALQTPEVRQEEVDHLQQSVADGSYKLDSAAIAEAILSR